MSHDFAKAFWGDGRICEECGSNNLKADRYGVYCKNCKEDAGVGIIAWEWHLSHMVLEENPIKYLEGFL